MRNRVILWSIQKFKFFWRCTKEKKLIFNFIRSSNECKLSSISFIFSSLLFISSWNWVTYAFKSSKKAVKKLKKKITKNFWLIIRNINCFQSTFNIYFVDFFFFLIQHTIYNTHKSLNNTAVCFFRRRRIYLFLFIFQLKLFFRDIWTWCCTFIWVKW